MSILKRTLRPLRVRFRLPLECGLFVELPFRVAQLSQYTSGELGSFSKHSDLASALDADPHAMEQIIVLRGP